ncbi:MAG: GNAT family N-acetyltransferase [Jatrophihabitantaceae bacterium]
MQPEVTRDPDAIIALIEPLLAADPVRNTVFSSVSAGLRARDADGWCAHPPGEPSVLAVRSQRHTPLVVTAGWTDIAGLADAVVALPCLAALGGPVPAVHELVAALGQRGIVATSELAERLFRLDELTEPGQVAGMARLASLEDLEPLADWYRAFRLDVFGRLPEGFEGTEVAELAVRQSRLWLWTDPAGVPCSMAGRHYSAFGVSRIGPVYTPPELRGRGYAAAVTAAATRDALGAGSVPVLYTDVANPTSNRLYQRLGYYPVEDRASAAFS